MGLAKELKAPPCVAAPTGVSWVSLCQIESRLVLARTIVRAWYAVSCCTLARVARGTGHEKCRFHMLRHAPGRRDAWAGVRAGTPWEAAWASGSNIRRWQTCIVADQAMPGPDAPRAWADRAPRDDRAASWIPSAAPCGQMPILRPREHPRSQSRAHAATVSVLDFGWNCWHSKPVSGWAFRTSSPRICDAT